MHYALCTVIQLPDLINLTNPNIQPLTYLASGFSTARVWYAGWFERVPRLPPPALVPGAALLPPAEQPPGRHSAVEERTGNQCRKFHYF